MALEHSVLNQQIIARLIKEKYDLNIIKVQKTELGSANCFRVNDGKKDYFLKEFQAQFVEEDLIREAQLLDHLAEKGIPVAQMIKTNAGDYAFEYEGHMISLQEYVQGHGYGYNDFPEKFLSQTAAMLGKIHTALKEYSLPMGMDQEWLSSYDASMLCREYDELAKSVKPEDPHYAQLMEDFQYKKVLSVRCTEYLKYYDGITYGATHGDYQGCQLICDGDGIKAVIDFSSAQSLPLVWEIMRSYVQSSNDARNEAVIDIQGLYNYVKEYMKFAALSETDLKAMPYVYLFQLARSKYGYKEYLTSDSEDREGLILFAFWRTQMCREVEARAKEIERRLEELYKE